MVGASERYVRLLVRRPHAYKFIDAHKGAIVPGVALLEADGRLASAVALNAAGAKKSLLDALAPPPPPK